MRALHREDLEESLLNYLRSMQNQVDGSLDIDIEPIWKGQRQTKRVKKIVETLRRMTGKRERCMYCEDSRGTDIEHFWPKKSHPERAFRWDNLLLACAACNRVKGDRFPRDDSNRPLLIDPTAVDPWDFLFYDPETDELAARWDPQTGEEHPEGMHTLKILSTLRHQAVTEGRKRTRRNLERTIKAFLQIQRSSSTDSNIRELLESIEDNDDYGLINWYFLRDGQRDSPFAELRRSLPAIWEHIVIHVRDVINQG